MLQFASLPGIFETPKRMKNILLGVLLVALAAVVVNKKMWKHRTFLLIVVGIMVAMMAVSMFAGKEMFQTPPSTASTDICTKHTNNVFPSLDIVNLTTYSNVDWNALMTNAPAGSGTPPNKSDGTPLFTGEDGTIKLYNYADPALKDGGGNYPAAVSRLRNWLGILRYMYGWGCSNKVLDFFTWAMSNNTMIFPYQYKNASYTGDLNTDVANRYMNFVYELNSNSSLRAAPAVAANINPSGSSVNEKLNAYDGAQMPFIILHMISHWYNLRNYYKKDSPENQKVYYSGIWLGKVVQFQRTISSLRNNPQFIVNLCNTILSKCLIPSISNWMPGENAQYIYNVACGYFTGVDVAGIPGIRVHPMTGSSSTNAKTANAVYLNRIPGFIFECTATLAGNAFITTDQVIMMHSYYLHYINMLLLCMKYVIGNNTYDSVPIINFINSTIKNMMEPIVKNVCAPVYIMEAATAKGMTPVQLDTLMRNYIGDSTKCIQPLTVDKLLGQINTPEYSLSTLTTSSIPTLGSTVQSIAEMLQKAVFKSSLDTNNRSWLSDYAQPDPTSTDPAKKPTNQPLPDMQFIKSADLKHLIGHKMMFDFIFNTANTQSNASPSVPSIPNIGTSTVSPAYASNDFENYFKIYTIRSNESVSVNGVNVASAVFVYSDFNNRGGYKSPALSHFTVSKLSNNLSSAWLNNTANFASVNPVPATSSPAPA